MQRWLPALLAVVFVPLLLSAPWWTVNQPYLLHMLILMCVFAIPAVGLNLMLGYSGLVSLGHMGFAGLGAYVAAVLMVDARGIADRAPGRPQAGHRPGGIDDPVADGPGDRGEQYPQPPARQRVVQLLDAVPLVAGRGGSGDGVFLDRRHDLNPC